MVDLSIGMHLLPFDKINSLHLTNTWLQKRAQFIGNCINNSLSPIIGGVSKLIHLIKTYKFIQQDNKYMRMYE